MEATEAMRLEKEIRIIKYNSGICSTKSEGIDLDLCARLVEARYPSQSFERTYASTACALYGPWNSVFWKLYGISHLCCGSRVQRTFRLTHR